MRLLTSIEISSARTFVIIIINFFFIYSLASFITVFQVAVGFSARITSKKRGFSFQRPQCIELFGENLLVRVAWRRGCEVSSVVSYIQSFLMDDLIHKNTKTFVVATVGCCTNQYEAEAFKNQLAQGPRVRPGRRGEAGRPMPDPYLCRHGKCRKLVPPCNTIPHLPPSRKPRCRHGMLG